MVSIDGSVTSEFKYNLMYGKIHVWAAPRRRQSEPDVPVEEAHSANENPKERSLPCGSPKEMSLPYRSPKKLTNTPRPSHKNGAHKIRHSKSPSLQNSKKILGYRNFRPFPTQ
jgi:hypothetical protein